MFIKPFRKIRGLREGPGRSPQQHRSRGQRGDRQGCLRTAQGKAGPRAGPGRARKDQLDGRFLGSSLLRPHWRQDTGGQAGEAQDTGGGRGRRYRRFVWLIKLFYYYDFKEFLFR